VAGSSQRAAESGDLPLEEQADRRPMGHAGEARPAPRCTDHRLHRRVHPSGLDQALLAAGGEAVSAPPSGQCRLRQVAPRQGPHARRSSRPGWPGCARSSTKSGSSSLEPPSRLRGRDESHPDLLVWPHRPARRGSALAIAPEPPQTHRDNACRLTAGVLALIRDQVLPLQAY
jgi:hypothetical protein